MSNASTALLTEQHLSPVGSVRPFNGSRRKVTRQYISHVAVEDVQST